MQTISVGRGYVQLVLYRGMMHLIWEMRLRQLLDATDLVIVFYTHSHFMNKLKCKGYWVLRGKELTELKI